LAALRGGGRVTEIRLEDLRFNATETSDFLKTTSGLTVGDRALANLQKRTEGWVLALRLVSLQLRHVDDPEDFLTHLSGGMQQVRDYLLQEVWSRRSPQMQSWLFKTSILEAFCPDLCDAVCSPDEKGSASDLDGLQFVEALQRTNLFTVSLDDSRAWFRYHHLFQSLLQEQLELRRSPDEITELHVRASEWCETHGNIEKSIRHALKAGDASRATGIFERHRRPEQDADRWRAVERWLGLLPEEMRRQRPSLLLADAWVLHDRFQLREIAPIVELVGSMGIDEAVDRVLLGELNFFQGVLLFWQGRGEECLKHMLDAREKIPHEHPRMTGLIEIYIGLARQMIGQEDSAMQELNEFDLGVRSKRPEFLSRVALAQALMHSVAGELELAALASQRVEKLSREIGIPYMTGWSHYLPACSSFRSNDLETAMTSFARVVERRYSTHTRAAIDSMAGLALTYQAVQRSDDASAMTEQLLEFALETGDSAHLAVARSAQARISLAQGEIERAASWERSFNEAPNAPGMLIWLEVPAITQTRVLVAIGTESSLREAVVLLRTLEQATAALNNTCQTIEISILLALALEKQGQSDEALAACERAISLAGPRGWIRPFVELGELMAHVVARLPVPDDFTHFSERILSAIDEGTETAGRAAKPPLESSVLFETLTNRELDVLELLAKRLQNKEIAAELHIAPQTVNSHLKNIFQKLDVGNRRQAAAKALELNLLSRN
jgi:LuxR family maltose regulon positive regulatory protein